MLPRTRLLRFEVPSSCLGVSLPLDDVMRSQTDKNAEMWTAFGIFLGTAINLAVFYTRDGLNWRLMLGEFAPKDNQGDNY